jgi:tetratricopeptide (TPR) repeat protein
MLKMKANMSFRVSTLILAFGLVASGTAAGQPSDVLGEVSFPTSCSDAVQPDFDQAVALLHSFEFAESRGVFEAIAGRDPDCAMAQWGIAMTYYHPLWAPPTQRDLELGHAAADRASTLSQTQRERAYIDAIAAFYRNYEALDHGTRARVYEDAMAEVHEKLREDVEAEIFYGLAILSNADPTDKTYATQNRTGAMFEKRFADMPNHPGLAHYIIHSYDYPPLAERAVEAAHRYLEIAPSLAHALHMSSHIFTQEGMWDESIDANVRSASAARERGERFGTPVQAQLQEMHSLDYLAYAYLQQGRNEKAREVLEHIESLDLNWRNGVTAFNAGAVPVRYVMERHRWEEAAALAPPREAEGVEGNYEVRAAIALRYWARAVGAARIGDIASSERDLARVTSIAAELQKDPDVWARNTSEVLRLEAAAWLSLAKGDGEEALRLMRSAAALEDQTDKSSLSPGRVLPAHEQLGDMLMKLGRPVEALEQYEISLEHASWRFNSIYGAARAAQASGDMETAAAYYSDLLELVDPGSDRPELEEARSLGD